MNQTGGNERYQQLRVLSFTFTSALVFIGVALYFVLGSGAEGMSMPPSWVIPAQVVFALGAWGVVEAIGYRAPAAQIGDAAIVGASSAAAYQSAMMVRFAICESLAIISIALAFVLDPSTFVTYLTGGILSIGLLFVHVVPNERSLQKFEASLERSGHPSYIRQAFGLSA